MSQIYDVIVIGGGPAGYVGAIKAAQLGGKVAIVEKDNFGGTCLNRGCIPTKTYVKNAEIIEHINDAKSRGIVLDNTNFSLDMDKIVSYKNRVVRRLTTGVGGLLKSYGIDIYNGVGRLTKDKKVQIDEGDIIEGKKIVLAGGSKVARINIPGIDSPKVLTSDEILDLKELPERLAIVGGGVIGTEIATIFNAYGSKVTVIQSNDRIVPTMDEDVSIELGKLLSKKGVKILTSSRLKEIEDQGDKVLLHLEGKDPVEADLVLISIGRVPDLDGVGELEFEMNRGAIVVNDKMETSIEGIYAPGDINGQLMLAHAASKMAEVSVINALGGNETFKAENVPACVYSLPEVAAVGLTEEQAKEKYSNVGVGKFPFGANGRALASGEGNGFVKVVTNRDNEQILGVHIIGVSAAEMINEAAALMEAGVTAEGVAETIHGHPTFSEAFMEACADSFDKCIHLPKK
ncbi:dihydrolipoyl dehydrogenase LpdA [Gottschalkia purinilytica]|uniref:Dihydrolipoyl dehydrogenase n=1 Tax=Gottschalkia purinilytica TaxID=1503 RepID=A0A0L0WDI9_GOTPU|nr:dihydrolipoyl dehydrogenase [Gottschalkia purinilytica]KNF09490.1 dihydrolipoyl dehydrogenase LpdA [Gottschalkia purinilytica]